MLGNWSFGDYFKAEACQMAWDLLTGPYMIPKEKLYVTYFGGDEQLGLSADDECKEIWKKIGVPVERILPFGVSDNFWEMGPVGPCGPCTEIHYSHQGQGDVASFVNKGDASVVELWNLVFIQYNRTTEGTLELLPQHHIDTGMGLERLVAIMQGSKTNYNTDLFIPIFKAIERVCKCRSYGDKYGSEDVDGLDTAYRILADHTRMLTVALADGMMTDINYKLRRIVRRAIMIGQQKFGKDSGLVTELSNHVSEILGPAFPEISKNLTSVHYQILFEEEQLKELQKRISKDWSKIIAGNDDLANIDIAECPGIIDALHELDNESIERGSQLPVELAFKLYDTFGVKKHIIKTLADIKGLEFNWDDFDNTLLKVRHSSRELGSSKINLGDVKNALLSIVTELRNNHIAVTDDSLKYEYSRIGSNNYEFPEVSANIKTVIAGGKVVQKVVQGQDCLLLVDKTNFYSEAGGQVSDVGVITTSCGATINVNNVLDLDGYKFHECHVVSGCVNVGDSAVLKVDKDHRAACMCNHTATHLFNASIRQLLVVTGQRSSYVAPTHLAFDFSVLGETFSADKVKKLENQIENWIQADLPVIRCNKSMVSLLENENVCLLPGEIYPDNVHVIEVAGSVEPCCGTHVKQTSDIGAFCVVSLKSGGTGIKSVRAVTGQKALEARRNGEQLLEDAKLLSVEQDPKLCQKLLDRLTSSVRSSENLLPLVIRLEVEQLIEVTERRIRAANRLSETSDAAEEIHRALNSPGASSFLVHVLSKECCESGQYNLSRVTRVCQDRPIMVISRNTPVKVRCCVPQGFATEKFNAEKWMALVADILGGSYSAPKGQNPRFVVNFKQNKKLNEDSELLEEVARRACDFALANLNNVKDIHVQN